MSAPSTATGTISVTAFVCSSCKGLRKTETEADSCCTCKCGVKKVREKGSFHYPSDCPTCSAKTRIRYARERVRKLTGELKDAKTNLERSAEEYTALTGKRRDLKVLDDSDPVSP